MIRTILLRALALGTAPVALVAAPALAQSSAGGATKTATQPTTPGEPVERTVSLTVYSQLATLRSPRLSPDGTKAMVTLSSGGDLAYGILDVTGGNKPPTLIAKAGDFKNAGDRRVAGYTWVGDDNVVLTLESMEYYADAGQPVALRRLIGYNLKTKKLTPLAWDGAFGDGGTILHKDEDKGEIVVSRDTTAYGTERIGLPEVARINVASGKIVEILQRPNPIISNWAVDGHGVVRMGFGSDDKSGKLRMLYRSNAGDSFRTVSNVADKNMTGDGIKPEIFLDEPDLAIVTSNQNGYTRVYKANLSTMTLGEPLFEMKGYDVDGAVANDDENGVDGFAYTTDKSYVKWTNPLYTQIQTFLDEEFGRGNALIGSSNKNNTKFIVFVGDANQPGAYYLYDTQSGNFGLLGYVNNSVKDGKLNPVSAVTYRASDGRQVQAIVTMPRHRIGQKNLPVVALVHGGPYGVRDNVRYDFWAQAVAEQGYVVVQPNYRGSGGYGKDFLKIGRDEGFGFRMQDDVNDAVNALAAQGVVDAKRGCIMGWSYGGYAAARGAQRDPNFWRCAVAGAGVYDLPAMKKYDRDYLGAFSSNYLSAGASDIRQISPALNTNGKWAPILIVHGAKDPRVPVNQARSLVGSLKGSGKKEGTDFAYIEQPKNGHYGIYFTEAENLEWLKGATDWFARFNPAYLPGETPPKG